MPWRAPRGTLRRRLALTLAGLSALVVIVLGVAYGFTEYFIEKTAMREEMQAEIAALIRYEARGEHVPLVSTTLSYFPEGAAPPGLADLPPGAFRRLTFGNRPVQAIAAADPDGGVHVLVQDLTLMQRRERWLAFSLVAGVLVAAAGAWWASGRLSRRILGPLAGLVEQIRGIDPHRPTQNPVARTGDGDVDVIPDAVNGLLHELDHVLRRERAFADAASHELRTPLAVVRGAIDVLRERGDSAAPVVDRMERAARRAQEDLDALLALSPARSPGEASRIELRELLPAAAEHYLRESDSGTKVTWEWGSPTEAQVVPAALAIVFTNLLRNALRAAPGGEVRVEADARRVRLTDDGEGLPADWPENGEPRGRGLGLLIARTLAERHGWHVEVEPAEPNGTRATVCLDRGTSDGEAPGAGPTSASSRASRAPD